MSGSTVYFCWLCQKPVPDDAPSEMHYEADRRIWFCSGQCREDFQDLRAL